MTRSTIPSACCWRACARSAGKLIDSRPSPAVCSISSNETRSLPRRANNMPARAGEDRSLCSLAGYFDWRLSIYVYVCRPSVALLTRRDLPGPSCAAMQLMF
jgi:hypothetical protein